MTTLYYYRGNSTFSPVNGGSSLVLEAPTDPGEGSDPPPASWQSAVDTRDIDTVRAWYEANTGHEALGITEEDLVDGSIVSTYDGQVFEGIRASHVRIAHNNVTVRGCRIVDGTTYGLYYNPTFGATYTGNLIEYCTFERPTIEVESADAKSIAMVRPAYTNQRSLTFRHNNCYGWGGGVRMGNNVWCEYNWVHNAQYPGDAHLNMMRLQDVGGTLLRNYLDGGRSGSCSIYFDKEPTHSITYQENILYNTDPNGRPSYHILFKSGDYGPTATNIRIIDNYFGEGYQYGIMAGGNLTWNANGNVRSGNQMFLTGELYGNTV